MRHVAEFLERIAPSQATVTILGESGTGKEVVARALHEGSPRARQPFISVNCAALVPSLVESELFGHEKEAFTGADTQRKGAFESARGGTLFLDEVGELPLELQAKLLRVLESGEVKPLGANRFLRVDVRVGSQQQPPFEVSGSDAWSYVWPKRAADRYAARRKASAAA